MLKKEGRMFKHFPLAAKKLIFFGPLYNMENAFSAFPSCKLFQNKSNL